MEPDVRGIRRILLTLLTVLAFAPGSVACGGDESQTTEYFDKLNAAQEDFAQDVRRLGPATPTNRAQALRTLSGIGPLLSRLAGELEAIDPPDEVKAEHEKLVAEIRAYQQVISDNRRAAASDDPSRAGKAAGEISTAATRFQTEFRNTVNQINSKLRE